MPRAIGRNAELLLPGRRLITRAMNMINRSALVVEPAQPFLDWLHRVDTSSADLTLDDLRLDPSIYLLPEWNQ